MQSATAPSAPAYTPKFGLLGDAELERYEYSYLQERLAHFDSWIRSVIGLETTDFYTAIRLDNKLHIEDDKCLQSAGQLGGDIRILNYKAEAMYNRSAGTTEYHSKIEWENPLPIISNGRTFVYLKLDYCNYISSVMRRNFFLLCRHSDVEAAISYINLLKSTTKAQKKQTNLYTYTEASAFRETKINLTDPDSLAVSRTYSELRINLGKFLAARNWYENRRAPYRRGFLLYGAPGNGKTSSIKAISTEYCLDVYTVDFSNTKMDDYGLRGMYSAAGNNEPCIILFEDIDRVFGRDASVKTSVTYQCLLNCMDGIDTPAGIITIATANHPNQLDPAMIKRPGRFDRVIAFSNPDYTERLEFLRMRADYLTPDNLKALADCTDMFSFAQMSELWNNTSLQKFYDVEDVVPNYQDLIKGVESIRELYADLKDRKSGNLGFRSAA